LVQSVDSLHLLEAINNWGAQNGKVINVLLELHLGAEETKQGFTEDEILTLIGKEESTASGRQQFSEAVPSSLPNVNIIGIMGMATNTDDMDVVESDFARIERLFKRIQAVNTGIRELSIGMSADWQIAVKHSATMVRIGTDIFGPREM
ncbi:MAG: alanine racemase, partial [Bacteroidales bacterium]|nr:alanine racemase [Bacteroidales bacterium]